MPSTTTRLAFPYPVLADNADVPEDIKALADRLAAIGAGYSQGTAAARPAAGVDGRFYWTTDTFTLSYDSGTAWQQIWPPPAGTIVDSMVNTFAAISGQKIAAATALTALTLPGSMAASPGTGCRRDLATVGRLIGNIYNASGGSLVAGTTLATLPAGFRPTSLSPIWVPVVKWDNGANTYSTVVMSVGSSTLSLTSALPNGHVIFLDGVTYAI